MTTNNEPHDDRRMTPQEFRAAREALSLSAHKLAGKLGVHVRTVRRWADGSQDVPGPVAVAMRSFLREAA